MRRHYRIILMSIGIFFFLGLIWGLWSNRTSPSDAEPALIILCPKSWLPPEITEEISRRLKIRAIQLDFDSWSDFVRLAANTQGKADVICFHSFLARDLIQSKFLDKAQLNNLPHFRQISVDFLKLPFDPEFAYTAPLFWGVNGFVVKAINPTTWRQAWANQSHKIALLYPDLELLWRMSVSGLELHEEADADSDKLESFVHTFLKSLSDFSTNGTDFTDEYLGDSQIIQLSSGPAAAFLKDHTDWKYWLPADGVSVWFGMAGIGSQSRLKSQAKDFIDELLSPEYAALMYQRLHHGVVQASLDGDEGLLPMQKARYVREIPLDRIRFPNLTLEILPRWERVISESEKP